MAGRNSLLTGQTLAGRYRIEDAIGRGLFAVVYRAEDEHEGRTVAVKAIAGLFNVAPGAPLHERLHREARAAASLQHPNVVPVYDFGIDPALGIGYVVMELLRGEDLATRLGRAGRPDPDEALRILRGAAEGLAAGHRAGMVHGNLKPENIFLREQEGDGAPRVVVLDFGILRGSPLSPAHASPEQLHGDAQLSPASDVFSLGAVGYQLLTGETPPRTDGPARPERGDATGVMRVITRAIATAPGQRFPDAAAMRDALDATTRGPEPMQPPVPAPVAAPEAEPTPAPLAEPAAPPTVVVPVPAAEAPVVSEAAPVPEPAKPLVVPPAPPASPPAPPASSDENLAAHLTRRGRLPRAEALRIFRDAVEGLAAGHRVGIVHGQVKPENFVLRQPEHGGVPRVVVLAPQQTEDAGSSLSRVYSAPEQLNGESTPTPASDVFSLGAVGYHLLAGERPFGEGGAARSFGWNAKAELLHRAPDLSQEVAGVIARALEYVPAVRFPHADAMLAGLDAAPVTVSPPPASTSPAPPPGPKRSRHSGADPKPRSAVLLPVLVLLLFSAGAGAAYVMFGMGEPEAAVEQTGAPDTAAPDTAATAVPVPRVAEEPRAPEPRPRRARRRAPVQPRPDTPLSAPADTPVADTPAADTLLGDPVPTPTPAPPPDPAPPPPPPDSAATVGSHFARGLAGARGAA